MSTDDEDEPDKDDGETGPDAVPFGEGALSFEESEKLSPETRAQFWMKVAAYEQAPSTTHFQLLEESGIELPAPESMGDEHLAAKLWEMIEGLARLRIFLSQTNHLSDRQLYELLGHDVLREAVKDLPLAATSVWHIDLAGSGSTDDTKLYLMYYADEDLRQQWAADFPDDEMPEHVEPPFDRDSYLPNTKTKAAARQSGRPR
jgi:hypothetical protein